MYQRIREDKTLRIMIGVLVIDIVLMSYAALTIYRTSQREVIMLAVGLAVGFVLFKELSKRLKKSPTEGSREYVQRRRVVDDFHRGRRGS